MLKKLAISIISLLPFFMCVPETYAKSILDTNQHAGTKPNIPDSGGDSIDEKLSEAVISLDVNGVQQALMSGANPNNFRGARSLVEMAILGVPSLKEETFKRDEDQKWIREEEKKCIEILKKLFNAGAKVEQSYLRWPIECNSVLILKLLLQRGANLYAPIGALTPIELAVKCNSQDVIDFLIKQGVKPVLPQDAAQLSLLDAAGNYDIIRMGKSLREGAKLEGEFKGIRFSVLSIVVSKPVCAFESEIYGAVAYLLQKGANPNFEGANGNTPLHLAMLGTMIYSGYSPDMLTAKKTYRTLSLQALVKAGANISSRNNEGKTPLHVAAVWDNLFGAKFLIENGANINHKDQDGKTPLDYAKSAEMIKLLKDAGAT